MLNFNLLAFTKKEGHFSWIFLGSALLFSLLPFLVYDKFPDAYTTIKWIVLLLTLNGLFFVWVWNAPSLCVPSLSRLSCCLLGFIAGVLIFNAFYHNVPLYLYEHDKPQACKLFRQFDSFFHNQSSVHDLIDKECK